MADDTIKMGGKALLFRSIFEQNVIGIVLCDLDGTILETNAAFCQMVGYSDRELRSLTVARLTHPDDMPATRQFFGEAERVGQDLTAYTAEKRYLRKDGSILWGRVNATAIRDGNGVPIFTFATVEDITQRKVTEHQLAAETERLAVTLHAIGDAVISVDSTGQIVLFNEVAERLTGWRGADAKGRPLTEVLHLIDAKSRAPCRLVLEQALQRMTHFASTAPLLIVSRDGNERCVSGTGNPIRPESGVAEGMVFAFRDITDRMRAEEEQARTEKLESLGYLAGGIAHDFNNLLTTILGNISLAKLDAPAGDLTELLQQAEQASLEARKLTQQLLTFAKGGAPIKQVVPPGPLIREATDFALRGSSCRPELQLPGDLWTVCVDPDLIGQVIRHIVMNADQAMPGGGRLTIEAENRHLEAGSVAALEAGRYVVIRIQDTGVGIAADHLEHIFDPYFTTKPKSSGLGLAASLSIVRNHGGHIAVESRVGAGTRFFIYLPAATTPSPARPATSPASPGRPHPRVLVMDDEEGIRHLTTRILTRNAFRVQTAANGEEMLHLFKTARTSDDPFDLAILDLTIRGGMGGQEAMRELLQLDPSVKVIVSSGYSNDPILSNYRDFGFRGMVAKPYQPETLMQAVRGVIAG